MSAVDSEFVIGRIYDAVADRDRWSTALQSANELVAAAGMMLLYCDMAAGRPKVFATAGFDSGVLARLTKRYPDDDLVRESMQLPVGLVVSRILTIEDEQTRTTVFRKTMANDCSVQIAGAAAVRNEDVYASLWMVRSRDMPLFSARDVFVFSRLLPHVGRVMTVHHRLASAQLEATMAAGAIDRIAVGMVLLDIGGKAVLTNREANRILGLDDGVSMIGRQLVASSSNQTAELRRTIRRVSGTGSNGDANVPHQSAAVRINRSGGRIPYHVVVVPLPRRCQPSGVGGAVAVLFITDPERGQSPADVLCGDLYGLTAAEVRLVSALLEYSGLTAAAKGLGVSRNTAHSQLKSVFLKTGTRSQGELLRLILGTIAPVEQPDTASGFYPAIHDPEAERD